jgi:hypothetical protein
MHIKRAYSFIAPIGKGDSNLRIDTRQGTTITVNTNVFRLIERVLDRSGKDCNVPVAFTPQNGRQENPVRTMVIELIRNPNLTQCLPLVRRLASYTTNVSGIGLVFFIVAEDDSNSVLLISRFPAEHGITTERSERRLTVEYVENVFMRTSYRYKAVLYRGRSLNTGFWDGFAVDKQIAQAKKELSDYWVRDFLASELKLTPERGSEVLAKLIKDTIAATQNVAIAQQLLSCVNLIENLNGKNLSVKSFCNRFGLGENIQTELISRLPNKSMADKQFIFNQDEFKKHARYRTVYLDNDAILSAPADRFEGVWRQEDEYDKTKFSTIGKVKEQKIRSRL